MTHTKSIQSQIFIKKIFDSSKIYEANLRIYLVLENFQIEYPNIFRKIKTTNRILEYICLVKIRYLYSNIIYFYNIIPISKYIWIFVVHWYTNIQYSSKTWTIWLKNWSKAWMLKQEIDSYIIIIWACAHNKEDNKQSEDTWWWIWR